MNCVEMAVERLNMSFGGKTCETMYPMDVVFPFLKEKFSVVGYSDVFCFSIFVGEFVITR